MHITQILLHVHEIFVDSNAIFKTLTAAQRAKAEHFPKT